MKNVEIPPAKLHRFLRQSVTILTNYLWPPGAAVRPPPTLRERRQSLQHGLQLSVFSTDYLHLSFPQIFDSGAAYVFLLPGKCLFNT